MLPNINDCSLMIHLGRDGGGRTLPVLALLAATTAAPLAPLRTIRSRGGLLEVRLDVVPARFAVGQVSLRTRTYNASVPGPDLRVRRGDLLRMRLVNRLAGGEGPKSSAFWSSDGGRVPAHVNATNIHLHGMHLPATPLDADRGTCGDNIKCIVPPGRELIFEHRIPMDHPAGTYWYHPHVHGTAALQVGGLMAGAIVVEEDPGELSPALEQLPDLVLLIQMLHYDAIGAVTHDAIAAKRQDLDFSVYQGPKVNTILVNGQFMPSISLRAREAQRLRLINANEVANFELVVGGGSCSMLAIAYDGVYLEAAVREPVIILATGGRADVVVVCQFAGEYILRSDKNTIRSAWMGHHARISAPIMRLVVAASDAPGAAAEGLGSGGRRCEAIGDAGCGEDGGIGTLPARPPYMQGSLAVAPLLTDAYELKMGQTGAPGQADMFLLNDKTYLQQGEELASRVLVLGAVDEWRIWSEVAPGSPAHAHPFHSHVNHFQVIDYQVGGGRVDAHHSSQQGNSSHSEPEGREGAALPGFVGQWRDTLLIPGGDATVRVRFLPVAWCGDMVTLHPQPSTLNPKPSTLNPQP